VSFPELLPDEQIKECLYQAIRELSYVQSVENCNSGLCATTLGEAIIEKGMELLRVKDLAREHLYGK
jgi:hypothetical protein